MHLHGRLVPQDDGPPQLAQGEPVPAGPAVSGAGVGVGGQSGGGVHPAHRPSLLLVQELVEPMVQQHQLSLPVWAFPHQNWGRVGSSSLFLGCSPQRPTPSPGALLTIAGVGVRVDETRVKDLFGKSLDQLLCNLGRGQAGVGMGSDHTPSPNSGHTLSPAPQPGTQHSRPAPPAPCS